LAAVVWCVWVSSAPEAAQRVSCFVSILPQQYFVERIGAAYVDVHVMVGPGQSPASYEPTSKQLTQLAGARAYFAIGVPFEKSLLGRIWRNFDDVEVVDTRKGITLAPMAGGGGHGHESLDPHVWLSPRLAAILAHNVRDALVRIDPAHGDEYDANFDALAADLHRLDREIAELLAPFAGGRFYAFHPAYGYFAREYGLVQVAVEFEGASPGPRHLATVIEQAEVDGVEVLFVQPQFSQRAARTVAHETGAAVVPLDPLAPDYVDNLRDIAEKIAAALGGGVR